jgi:hypothetical protein
MAGLATSLPSAARQTGSTLGVAISGTIVGPASARGGMAFTSAEHGVWWLVLELGVGILVLALISTGHWALDSAKRTADQFWRVSGYRLPRHMRGGGSQHRLGGDCSDRGTGSQLRAAPVDGWWLGWPTLVG